MEDIRPKPKSINDVMGETLSGVGWTAKPQLYYPPSNEWFSKDATAYWRMLHFQPKASIKDELKHPVLQGFQMRSYVSMMVCLSVYCFDDVVVAHATIFLWFKTYYMQ